jgi:uncharacterized membrane-anchored protein YitT (DUF2179 family)
MIRLIYFLPTYLIFTLFINVPTIILGWILIPIHAIFYKYTTKTVVSIVNGRDILVWKHKYMFIWSNNEDGVLAGDEYKNMPNWFRIIYWSALRNPSNNLRFIKYLSVKLNPSKIKFKANITYPNLRDYDVDHLTFITLTWQGLLSNYRIQFRMFGKIWRFWIGWKIYPHDKLGVDPKDYRFYGAGFATQFKRIHPR